MREGRIAREAMVSRKPLRLSDCRFRSDEVDVLNAMFDHGRFNLADMRRLRRESAPAAPPIHLQQQMESVSMWCEPAVDKPPWLSACCFRREYFAQSAFFFNAGGATLVHKFLYALRNPVLACFSLMQQKPIGYL